MLAHQAGVAGCDWGAGFLKKGMSCRLAKLSVVQPMHGAPARVQVFVPEFHCRSVQSA
jgi:hypothetical protein